MDDVAIALSTLLATSRHFYGPPCNGVRLDLTKLMKSDWGTGSRPTAVLPSGERGRGHPISSPVFQKRRPSGLLARQHPRNDFHGPHAIWRLPGTAPSDRREPDAAVPARPRLRRPSGPAGFRRILV